jgi:hypothetical protein
VATTVTESAALSALSTPRALFKSVWIVNLGVVEEAVADAKAWLSPAYVEAAAVPWRSQEVDVPSAVVPRAVTVTVQVVETEFTNTPEEFVAVVKTVQTYVPAFCGA